VIAKSPLLEPTARTEARARIDAVKPEAPPPDAARASFVRGGRWPRAVAWFGIHSFWGHVWHLVASAIATEDIDSRHWMHPDSRAELTRRVAVELRARHDGPSLTEALGREVWIDYVADTGDDAAVSAAVARLLVAHYEVEDPDDASSTLALPRGDLLVFGGDTAYPVATDQEIHNRVLLPFGEVLRGALDGRPRVLLGIPGNHDWYAGLDGFGRMFRRRRGELDRMSRVPAGEVDRQGPIGHFAQWIEAFRVGHFVARRAILPLDGYDTVQSASYFALRLAPALDLWGADRQLRTVDFHQQAFFAEERDGAGLVLLSPDPARAFLEPSAFGASVVDSLDLSLEHDGVLMIAGDTHHYCREQVGRSTHVIAGGGGAFLHPARMARRGLPEPAAEFPGPRASLALSLRIPWRMASGRAGLVMHLVFALVYLPTYVVDLAAGEARLAPSAATAVIAGLSCALLGGWRRDRPLAIGSLAAVAGLAMGFLPFAIHALQLAAVAALGLEPLGAWALIGELVVSAIAGTFLGGAYLTALTVLGLEHHQGFSALAHPGFKHFVRMRVRRDGSGVDAWVLGQVDPLAPGEPVVLVDRFRWENPSFRGPRDAA
jgi:hypothetical protein